jgi:hypothetical protein
MAMNKNRAQREHKLNAIWQEMVDQYDADFRDVLTDITVAADLLTKLKMERAAALISYVGLKLIDHDATREEEREENDG